jgi:hypothetical protein
MVRPKSPPLTGGNSNPPPSESLLQFDQTVIPGEPRNSGRDPESRKVGENQNILDPGSHPAPRDLAGMTNCDAVAFEEGDVPLKE